MKTACQCGLLKFLGKLTVGGDGKGIEVKYQPNCACNIVSVCDFVAAVESTKCLLYLHIFKLLYLISGVFDSVNFSKDGTKII